MKERIFETIKEIQAERRAAGLVPDHATRREIMRRNPGLSDGQLWLELMRLKEEGRIRTGRTINGDWVREKEQRTDGEQWKNEEL